MNLHLPAPVAEPLRLGDRRRRDARAVQQLEIQGLRGHVRKHGALRLHDRSVGRPHAGRAPAGNHDPLHRPAGLAHASGVADDRCQRLDQPNAASARHRHPAELDRDRDHLRHEARRRRVGPEAGVQHPGREQTVDALRLEGFGQPVARGRENVAGERDQPPAAESAVRLQRERETRL